MKRYYLHCPQCGKVWLTNTSEVTRNGRRLLRHLKYDTDKMKLHTEHGWNRIVDEEGR